MTEAETAYKKGTDYQFESPIIELGEWTSNSLLTDPRHLCFVLSRYKFCAKVLERKNSILEVGCGDGFGLPIVAQGKEIVYAADWDARLLEGNKRRLSLIKNIEFRHVNFNKHKLAIKVDGITMIDVLEHLDPATEHKFMKNVLFSLSPNGVMIVGIPNITAEPYSSPQSKVQHINLKSGETLYKLMSHYFKNVFMFSMNDEVIHTGYSDMAHYLLAIGV